MAFNFLKKDEEKKLRQVFRFIDHKNKNRLSKIDFEKTFKENGINATDEQIQNMVNVLDSDGNNSIEYQEFLRATCDPKDLYNDKNLKSAFDSLDSNKKGYIDADDIKNFIFKKKKVEEKRFLEYLKQIGMDLKSKLKFDHFADMMRNQKLFSLNKGKKEELEEDEKNKQDTNINETKENE